MTNRARTITRDMVADPSDGIRFYNSIIPNERGCWIWHGTVNNSSGYGVMAIDGETYLVHRISFALRHGSTPPHPLVVGHECDVKLCVNQD